MLLLNEDVETPGLRSAAESICLAARTAPKGKGKDLLATALVTDEEKSQLAVCRTIRAEAKIWSFEIRF
jgi:uncharacterized ferredoxin-like protein